MKSLSNDIVIHKKEEGVEYLQFRKLLEYEELVHCFTLKNNEFDIAGNQSFEGKKEEVLQNYETLAKSLGILVDSFVRPYQTHTNQVNCIKEKVEHIQIFPKELTNVDGLLTKEKGITFSLTFADCTPIYLWDPIEKVIGELHSGWKGTLHAITKVGIQKMVEAYGTKPENLICCIGPHIRKCHFEVGEKLAKEFKEAYQQMQGIEELIYFIGVKNGENKYHIDTAKINENLMLEMKVKKENIFDSNICTVCEKEQIHSYRAKSLGRNTAVIGMR